MSTDGSWRLELGDAFSDALLRPAEGVVGLLLRSASFCARALTTAFRFARSRRSPRCWQNNRAAFFYRHGNQFSPVAVFDVAVARQLEQAGMQPEIGEALLAIGGLPM